MRLREETFACVSWDCGYGVEESVCRPTLLSHIPGTNQCVLALVKGSVKVTVVSVCACSGDHQKAGNLLRGCTLRARPLGVLAASYCWSQLPSVFLSSLFHPCEGSKSGNEVNSAVIAVDLLGLHASS